MSFLAWGRELLPYRVYEVSIAGTHVRYEFEQGLLLL